MSKVVLVAVLLPILCCATGVPRLGPASPIMQTCSHAFIQLPFPWVTVPRMWTVLFRCRSLKHFWITRSQSAYLSITYLPAPVPPSTYTFLHRMRIAHKQWCKWPSAHQNGECFSVLNFDIWSLTLDIRTSKGGSLLLSHIKISRAASPWIRH